MGIIYCAQNLVNQKIYIGKTMRSFEERKREHKGDAERRINNHFYNAIKKYGFNIIDWCILAKEDDEEKLYMLEKYWIDILKTKEKQYGYNLTDGGEGPTGHKHLIETKQKMSIFQKKAWADPGIRARKITASRGRIISEKVRKKMSESAKKRKSSEETKTKISRATKGENNPMYGKKFSEESKRKMSESSKGQIAWNKGKKLGSQSKELIKKRSMALMGRVVTEETRQKLRIANTGKIFTKEHKRKLKEVRKNQIFTEETKKKLSLALKKRWRDPEYRKKMSTIAKKRWEVFRGRDNN